MSGKLAAILSAAFLYPSLHPPNSSVGTETAAAAAEEEEEEEEEEDRDSHTEPCRQYESYSLREGKPQKRRIMGVGNLEGFSWNILSCM